MNVFSPEEVANLNAFQRNSRMHPFTCGGDRGDAAHVAYAREHGDPDIGLLVATTEGWVCPVCGYRQMWAHEIMKKPLPAALMRHAKPRPEHLDAMAADHNVGL